MMKNQHLAIVAVATLTMLAIGPLHCAPIDDIGLDDLIAVKEPAVTINKVSRHVHVLLSMS
jgi:hypothetical protein